MIRASVKPAELAERRGRNRPATPIAMRASPYGFGTHPDPHRRSGTDAAWIYTLPFHGTIAFSR